MIEHQQIISERPPYWPYRGRQVLTLVLEADSPIQVGSGLSAVFDGSEAQTALVVRDGNGRPWLPPTTLKGALRSVLALGGYSKEVVEALFGFARDNDTGRPGLLTISGAVCDEATVDTVMRVAIDPASGTADTNKLFRMEQVQAGTKWTARLTVPAHLAGWHTDPTDPVRRLLATWKHAGLRIGRGKADGQGLLKLVAIQKVEHHAIPRSVQLPTISPKELFAALTCGEALSSRTKSWTLWLTVDGPFAVLTGQKTGNRLTVLMVADCDGMSPLLPGSSLAGAIKAAFGDWERRRALRGDPVPQGLAERLFGASADQVKASRQAGSRATGQSGAWRIDRIACARSGRRMRLPSVSIDRFTMAAREGALFEVDCFVDPAFEVDFYLDHRGLAEDAEEIDRFIEWLSDENRPHAGLDIGYGGNRGFGWCRVERLVRHG